MKFKVCRHVKRQCYEPPEGLSSNRFALCVLFLFRCDNCNVMGIVKWWEGLYTIFDTTRSAVLLFTPPMNIAYHTQQLAQVTLDVCLLWLMCTILARQHIHILGDYARLAWTKELGWQIQAHHRLYLKRMSQAQPTVKALQKEKLSDLSQDPNTTTWPSKLATDWDDTDFLPLRLLSDRCIGIVIQMFARLYPCRLCKVWCTLIKGDMLIWITHTKWDGIPAKFRMSLTSLIAPSARYGDPQILARVQNSDGLLTPLILATFALSCKDWQSRNSCKSSDRGSSILLQQSSLVQLAVYGWLYCRATQQS